MTSRDSILELKARMGRDIVGQEHILERILIGLLADGNLLVEGLPGWGAALVTLTMLLSLTVAVLKWQSFHKAPQQT